MKRFKKPIPLSAWHYHKIRKLTSSRSLRALMIISTLFGAFTQGHIDFVTFLRFYTMSDHKLLKKFKVKNEKNGSA